MSSKNRPTGSTAAHGSDRRSSRLLVAGITVALGTTVAVAPLSSTASASGGHRSRTDSYVAAWDVVGTQAFTAAALSPAEGHVIFGYAGIAVYDAVMAVRHAYEPFAIHMTAPRRTSPQAAVVAAAHRIYEHYLPDQEATILDPAYRASLATIRDGQAKSNGVAVGRRVANALIAQREDDGFRADVGYSPRSPALPGDWVPTATTPPIGTYLGHMRPFALESADQFRADGPPALRSARWARDYNQAKRIGSATSTTRKGWQTTAALFWAEAPVQQAHVALQGVIAQHHLNLVQAARMMAMASVAYADGIIACYDTKYRYEFWRPVTAIRAGGTDRNRATVGDPTWTPLLAATPNHPEYPSAHSCVTPAGFRALAAFLGTRRIDLTVPSLTGLGARHFDTVWELTREVGRARIWGGIHFRAAVKDGIRISKQTAAEVLDGNFGRARR
jgi:hypothetical protein